MLSRWKSGTGVARCSLVIECMFLIHGAWLPYLFSAVSLCLDGSLNLIGELLGHLLAVGHHRDQPLEWIDPGIVAAYPVAFSNMPRAPSVTFSFMPRCLAGSTLPCPNFFSAASRPEVLMLADASSTAKQYGMAATNLCPYNPPVLLAGWDPFCWYVVVLKVCGRVC